MNDKKPILNGSDIVKNGKGGFTLREQPEQPATPPESTPNATQPQKRVKTPPKPPAMQEPVSFNKLSVGIRLLPKKRPRGAMIIPKLAKAALAKVTRSSWPMLQFHMPKTYRENVKALQAAFGIYELGATPHEITVWVTRAMPKSWNKAKRADQLGRLIMSGSAGHVPDVDNGLGTVLDSLFPQIKEHDWGTGKDVLKPGTGDDMICRATIEMRWAEVDSIRVELKPMHNKPEYWPWLPKKKNTLF